MKPSNETEVMPAAANTQAVSAEKPPAGPAKAKEAEVEEGKDKAAADEEENAVEAAAEAPAKPKYEYKPGKNDV